MPSSSGDSCRNGGVEKAAAGTASNGGGCGGIRRSEQKKIASGVAITGVCLSPEVTISTFFRRGADMAGACQPLNGSRLFCDY